MNPCVDIAEELYGPLEEVVLDWAAPQLSHVLGANIPENATHVTVHFVATGMVEGRSRVTVPVGDVVSLNDNGIQFRGRVGHATSHSPGIWWVPENNIAGIKFTVSGNTDS